MVASSASAPVFVPAARPRVAIAGDGTLAAIHEPGRVVIIELPSCAQVGELGIDAEAGAAEVAWVGAVPRLVVLTRYAAHSTAHLVDPHGPRTLAEIRLEAPMKLCASVGNYALLVGPLGPAVLATTETHLAPYQFPARGAVLAAGAAGTQLVVALAGAIEEWDPQNRVPKRRLKLPRHATITAVGGSDRVVWMTTQQDPTRVDVIPLVNRGQPKAHELPEPIGHVASHPRTDLIVCIGADSGRMYLIDLDGRTAMTQLGSERIDHVEAAGLVLGRVAGVLAAQTRRPLALVAFAGREAEPAPAPVPAKREAPAEPATRSSLYEETDAEPRAEAASDQPPAITPAAKPTEPAAARTRPSLFRQPAPAPTPAPAARTAPVAPTTPVPSLTERFSTWRERLRNAQPRGGEVVTPTWAEAPPSWREEATTWARAVIAGSIERNPPPAPLIEALLARFELAPQLYPALVLLYGAHLGGERGVAPIDIARVLGRHWDEALGVGELAARGVAVYKDSRVRLARRVQRALDTLPPRTGTLIGEPGTVALLGPCAVVAPPSAALPAVAEACQALVGSAILAAHANADVPALVLEARAYGAVPMLRITADTADQLPTDTPMILVADDDVIAEQLGIPRLS